MPASVRKKVRLHLDSNKLFWTLISPLVYQLIFVI